jgi:hypothetical protein
MVMGSTKLESVVSSLLAVFASKKARVQAAVSFLSTLALIFLR